MWTFIQGRETYEICVATTLKEYTKRGQENGKAEYRTIGELTELVVENLRDEQDLVVGAVSYISVGD